MLATNIKSNYSSIPYTMMNIQMKRKHFYIVSEIIFIAMNWPQMIVITILLKTWAVSGKKKASEIAN